MGVWAQGRERRILLPGPTHRLALLPKAWAGVLAASAGRSHSAWLRKLLPLFKSEPGEPFQSLSFSIYTSVIMVWTSDFRNRHIFLMEECKGIPCKIETPQNFASPRLCLDKEKQTKGSVLTQNLNWGSRFPRLIAKLLFCLSHVSP